MANKKKIVAALTALKKACQAAFDVLNEDETLTGSPAGQEPVRYAPQIAQGLRQQLAALEAQEPYAGLSPEEYLEKKAQERQQALDKLQEAAAEQLKALKAQREATPDVVTDEEPEETIDPDDEPDLDDEPLDLDEPLTDPAEPDDTETPNQSQA